MAGTLFHVPYLSECRLRLVIHRMRSSCIISIIPFIYRKFYRAIITISGTTGSHKPNYKYITADRTEKGLIDAQALRVAECLCAGPVTVRDRLCGRRKGTPFAWPGKRTRSGVRESRIREFGFNIQVLGFNSFHRSRCLVPSAR